MIAENKQILDNAEKGNFGEGILWVRKAGQQYCKDILREQCKGTKNPVKKLRKLLKEKDINDFECLTKKMQKEATEAIAGYDALEKKVTELGNDVKRWTLSNVTAKVNELNMLVSQLNDAHEVTDKAVGHLDAERKQRQKDKAAATRAKRVEHKRMTQIFADHNMPLQWQLELVDQKLVMDIRDNDEEKVASDQKAIEFSEFKQYKPSQDNEAEFKQESWTEPKWWKQDATGRSCSMCPVLDRYLRKPEIVSIIF